ncbi:MAG: hypothetical protein B7Y36_13090 [Novosphingobium sp. 28-62-57]|uniref:hypothetical protein n=1 Tax=unclassified Novosphingobium TaxID=2644732 RepID=UPI000BDA915C|nr:MULTISPECIES: hypothetical protein [unclassified Novosphingobium]OYW49071.1 MAG: hypothetical protein B7Z34_11920 [Novosphingobium sp. 12-62-10]OYZ09461.1 MAG: hypothetical protein B7Y36_13090 [Novosphingobium sp. 28-62-57]OZA33301.1 MAG: hypothetical protein B7X92_11575 [Novosphingobium sp. 17-62-9]HQS70786.1 hypothetical protein [Novosphingobium sp.]
MAGRFSKFALAAAGMASALLPLAAEARPGWNGGGWNRGGWGGRGWHRDRGIDGGDVLAGILIIGGIAAIASAASNANRNRERTIPRDNGPQDDGYRYRNDDLPRQDEWRSEGRVQDWQGSGQNSRGGVTSGIDGAVDSCVAEAQRNGEVDEVFNAARNGSGYRVSGALRNGDGFTCDVNGQGGVLLDIRRGQG